MAEAHVRMCGMRVVPIGTKTRTGIFLTPMKIIMAIRNTTVTTSNVENVYAKDKIPMVIYGILMKVRAA